MGVEVRALGATCNLQCQYCYQAPERDAAARPVTYDLDRIKQSLAAESRPFNLFGGEPLLLPIEDLESLWSWGFQKFGRNSVQTNGTLISERHLELFKKYKVTVGISIDGPGEMNDARWHGSLEKTRAATAQTESAIEALCVAGVPTGLIVTLTRVNASEAKLSRLLQWFRDLDVLGIRSVRLHLLESEHGDIREAYGLDADDNIRVLLACRSLEAELTSVRFDLFRDMRNMLLGRDADATCIFRGCDPHTTAAVRGVEGDGKRTNCGRVAKQGVNYEKTKAEGFERYLALYHTPQSAGGCKDCRFFVFCKGNCPGTAIDGDWRNRSEHCRTWRAIYEVTERDLIRERSKPLSVSPHRPTLETAMLTMWTMGRNPSIQTLLASAGGAAGQSTKSGSASRR